MKHSFFRAGLLAAALLFFSQLTLAQAWMSNYSYRKRITIDKDKVSPKVLNIQSGTTYQDLTDFPVWLDIQDEDLVHNPGACGNKISNHMGLDICFALSSSPHVPLRFQIERYHPETGRLQCWIKIPVLSARNTSSAPTSIYLYYGSTILHNPLGVAAEEVWSNDYLGVWHMNLDGLPPWTRNSKNNLPGQRAIASTGILAENYQNAMLGDALSLNGSSESIHIDIDAGTSFSIATWLRLRALGNEQVIASNDSLGSNRLPNGFSIKIDASGHLKVELHRSNLTASYSATSQTVIEPGIWHYLFVTTTGQDIFMSIDGQNIQGRSSNTQRLGQGGTLRLGASKQGTEFLNGMIDLFSIQQGVKGSEWFQTTYQNQKDPSNFYQLSGEEYAPGQYNKFTAAVNDSWQNAGNWSTGIVPGQDENILISAGKKLRVAGLSNFSVRQLILEQQATLALGNDLVLKCKAEIGSKARIELDEGVALTFEADIRNHGSISSNQHNGRLISAGFTGRQRLYGNGQVDIHTLELAQHLPDQLLNLESAVVVRGTLKLHKGILDANGQLTLMADAKGSAQFLPIEDTTQTSIRGNVLVQKYIHGDFPAPASARGWRLLCSPVYHTSSNTPQHAISAFQEAMFVTGAGGTSKGFDPSPLNGATIYTHDQSLPGSLTQKYQPIPTATTNLPFGKGVFVFSRGSRFADGAYQQQLANPPFSNPSGYRINHFGRLYTGDLQMTLNNNDKGQEGDGFHLLGNPYAADIVWNQLLKSNLTEFIWLFDPLNNAYQVSDAPQTIIPVGSGFFIRVASGNTIGSITFHEHAKKSMTQMSRLNLRMSTTYRISTRLSRGQFEQHFILKLKNDGDDRLTDQDALKIGEGYVNISSLCEGKALAIEERMLSAEGLSLPLYLKCWETGSYHIDLEGMDEPAEFQTYLKDNVTGLSHKATGGQLSLDFDFNSENSGTSGENRFTLLLLPNQEIPSENPGQISIYPNPFTDQLYINVATAKKMKIVFKDMQGKTVKTVLVKAFENMLNGSWEKLPPGAYLVQAFEVETGKPIGTFKAISY